MWAFMPLILRFAFRVVHPGMDDVIVVSGIVMQINNRRSKVAPAFHVDVFNVFMQFVWFK